MKLALALITSVLLATGVAYVVFSHYVAPAPAPAPPVETRARVEARVVAVKGEVERSAGEGWAKLAAGDALRDNDSVRTGTGGSAELAIDDAARVRIDEKASLRVTQLTEAVHRFQVNTGRVVADYQVRGERQLLVEDEAGATVTTQSGRFSIVADDERLAVATERGEATLSRQGASVVVPAGKLAIAKRNEHPQAATPIPVDLLLKVAQAHACEIRGQVDPGARLEIDGEPVPVSDTGRFEATLPRRGESEAVKIVAVDVSGRRIESSARCKTKPAQLKKFELKWKD